MQSLAQLAAALELQAHVADLPAQLIQARLHILAPLALLACASGALRTPRSSSGLEAWPHVAPSWVCAHHECLLVASTYVTTSRPAHCDSAFQAQKSSGTGFYSIRWTVDRMVRPDEPSAPHSSHSMHAEAAFMPHYLHIAIAAAFSVHTCAWKRAASGKCLALQAVAAALIHTLIQAT